MLRRFSRVLGELESRNLLHQTSDRIALEKHLEKSRVVYTGFDPTAKSLHVGNLLTIVALLHFQIHGHRPIALIGGATGSIGDPSGKSTERNAIDPAIMKQNTDAITCQLKTVFRNAELYAERQGHDITTKVQLENNLDWFKDIKLIDFLKFGRYFRVNSMMAKDSVKSRLQDQNGISFAEFSYQILQAYDFWKLFESKECTIQLGGSDQWGNITSGLDLVRKLKKEQSCFGITIPLVTTSTGAKFGKSEGNAIWLDPVMLPPFDFYQFFRKQPDTEVFTLLRYFTLLTPSRIQEIEDEHAKNPDDQLAQRILAEKVTELVHGLDTCNQVKTMIKVLFDQDFEQVSVKDIKNAFENDARLVQIDPKVLEKEIVSVLVETGVCSSKCIKN